MTLVYNSIIQHISSHGYININDYMQLIAQYYYSNLKDFGQKSDFITAPEISSIFGMTIGKWLLDAHSKLHSPTKFNIIELGAGSGKMLNDILTFLGTKLLNDNQVTVHIVEKSTSLKELQRRTLKQFMNNITIHWHDVINTLPQFPSFIIANEFFDALPIRQYLKQQDDWCEVVIKLDKTIQQLYHTTIEIDPILNKQLKTKYPLAQSEAIIEESLQTKNSFSYLCQHLKQNKGAMLIIDYGYEYHPQSRLFFNTTLQAIKEHKFSNILENVGTADITAHVDFYELINIAKLAKCAVNSSITQSKFLFKTGIIEIVKQHLLTLSPEEQYKFNFSLNRLLSPEQMGSIFRALEVYYEN